MRFRSFIIVGLVFLSAAARAQEWAAYGTISAEPTPGRICSGDTNGKDIVCASPAPFVDASGNVGIGTTTMTGMTNIRADSTSAAANFFALYLNGAQSTANTSNYYGVYVTPTYTAISGNTLAGMRGITSTPRNTSTGTITTMQGVWSVPQNESTGTVTTMQGVNATPQNASSGTVTTMAGVLAQPQNNSTGSITTMYGLYSRCENNDPGGTVANCYGLYLSTPLTTGAITNKYGVYQQDSNSTNYFAGNTGIGTASPATKLQVLGDLRVASTSGTTPFTNLSNDDGTVLANNASYVGGLKYLTDAEAGAIKIKDGIGISFLTAASGTAGNPLAWSEKMRMTNDGKLGVGTASPATSALVDISSTTKGLLPPRMTAAQRDAISAPAAGLTVYNSTTNALNVYSGSSWIALGSGSPAGSSGQIQFNNSGAFGADSNLAWDNTNKRLGIGTATPVEKLEVSGNIKASGTLQVANSAATCTSAADYGKFRYNPVNGKLQVCKP